MTTEMMQKGRYVATGALAITIWLSGLALLALCVEPTATVLVIGRQAATIRAVAYADVDLVDMRPAISLARSQRRGFVHDLYAGGAWLVLPAPDGGCLSPLQAGK